MPSIILIGMPGAGKSTVGVLTAKTLGRPFIDTDLLIQQHAGLLLQDIIDRDGLREFLRQEEQTILKLAARHHVIATGGSVVYSARAMRHLRTLGTVIYLKVGLVELERRVKNITTRGMVRRPEQSFRQLYYERKPLYKKHGQVTIDCAGKTMEEIVAVISRKLTLVKTGRVAISPQRHKDTKNTINSL
jgi:shikimate kinase